MSFLPTPAAMINRAACTIPPNNEIAEIIVVLYEFDLISIFVLAERRGENIPNIKRKAENKNINIVKFLLMVIAAVEIISKKNNNIMLKFWRVFFLEKNLGCM